MHVGARPSKRIVLMPLATAYAIAVAIAAVLALSLSLGVGHAWAGWQPGGLTLKDLCQRDTIVVSHKGKADDGKRSFGSYKAIKSTKSSNPKVASVEVQEYKTETGTYYLMTITAKNPGATTLSFTYKGKKHKLKYRVVAYKNPAKTFKIGSTNFTSKFAPKSLKSISGNGNVSVSFNKKSLSGKVTLKLAQGWKIKKMWYWTKLSDKSYKMNYFKNGNKISKALTVYAWVEKGNLREILYLYSTKQ